MRWTRLKGNKIKMQFVYARHLNYNNLILMQWFLNWEADHYTEGVKHTVGGTNEAKQDWTTCPSSPPSWLMTVHAVSGLGGDRRDKMVSEKWNNSQSFQYLLHRLGHMVAGQKGKLYITRESSLCHLSQGRGAREGKDAAWPKFYILKSIKYATAHNKAKQNNF